MTYLKVRCLEEDCRWSGIVSIRKWAGICPKCLGVKTCCDGMEYREEQDE